MAVLYGNTTNHWRSYMDYSESAATQMPNATITVKAGIQSQGWGFSIRSGISCRIECTGQSATSVSGQGFSSGTGATVSKQLTSRTFTIPRTRATQTVTVKVTVTNSSGYANGTSTVSRTFTISPLASHTVSYDANGGSNAPSAQTKWYGSILTLSTQVPTRTNHTFQGWATSSTGAVAYRPGGQYGNDANVTLYAIWKQSVSPPTVTNAHATRCTSAGVDNDEGTYYHVRLSYKADTSVVSANKVVSVKVEHRASGASAWAVAGTSTVSAASGSYASSACGGGSIGTGSSYEVRVTVTDAQGLATSVLLGVGPSYYTMDILANGRGVAFGRNCPAAGLYVNEPTYWFGDGGSGSVQLTGAQAVAMARDHHAANVAIATKTFSLHDGHLTGSVSYYMAAGVTFVEVAVNRVAGGSISNGARATGVTLPAGMRPAHTVRSCALAPTNNYPDPMPAVFAYVEASGAVGVSYTASIAPASGHTWTYMGQLVIGPGI